MLMMMNMINAPAKSTPLPSVSTLVPRTLKVWMPNQLVNQARPEEDGVPARLRGEDLPQRGLALGFQPVLVGQGLSAGGVAGLLQLAHLVLQHELRGLLQLATQQHDDDGREHRDQEAARASRSPAGAAAAKAAASRVPSGQPPCTME